MNASGLILLGAGYLLGNPKARESFGSTLQNLAGRSIDALNGLGKSGSVNANVAQPAEPTE